MGYCEHYFACHQHRGCKCEVCGQPLLYIPYETAPTAPRCHITQVP